MFKKSNFIITILFYLIFSSTGFSQTGQSIVRFSNQTFSKKFGNSFHDMQSNSKWEKLDPNTFIVSNELAHELEQDPAYQKNILIEPDLPIHGHTIPNDPLYEKREFMFMDQVLAADAWEFATLSPNIKIAIIDSGIDMQHEDLLQNIWTNPNEISDNGIDDDANGIVDDIHGYNFFDNNTRVQDLNGHGTMIAGIIGAQGNNSIGIAGIAWQTQMIPIKILDEKGISSISKAIAAINYARNLNVDIINASWGYSARQTDASASAILEAAIADAEQAGILFVSSSGNGTNYIGNNNDDPAQANYPSSYPLNNIIATAACDSNQELAFFSNYGLNSVDLCAPGIDIFSTTIKNDYNAMTGTSISAAFVTGAAALILEMNPELSPLETKSLLLQNTTLIPSLAGKIFSSGELNIAKALQASPSLSGQTVNTELAPTSEGPATTNDFANETSNAAGGCSLQKNNDIKLSPFIIILLYFILTLKVRNKLTI